MNFRKKDINELKDFVKEGDIKFFKLTWKDVSGRIVPTVKIEKHPKVVVCPLCKGSTNHPGSSAVPCPTCGGKGTVIL